MTRPLERGVGAQARSSIVSSVTLVGQSYLWKVSRAWVAVKPVAVAGSATDPCHCLFNYWEILRSRRPIHAATLGPR